jgi:ascorbate-specific PTS system EIIC-type component UlaA
MIGAHQSSPCMIFTIIGFISAIFTEGYSMVWKNTSGGNIVFLTTALPNSSTSMVFCPFDVLDCEPLCDIPPLSRDGQS